MDSLSEQNNLKFSFIPFQSIFGTVGSEYFLDIINIFF